jgi:hypothetical protein
MKKKEKNCFPKTIKLPDNQKVNYKQYLYFNQIKIENTVTTLTVSFPLPAFTTPPDTGASTNCKSLLSSVIKV